MSDLAALRAEVAELRDLVRELVDEQRDLARRLLVDDDRQLLQRLLPAAWAIVGASAWTTGDLAAAAVAAGTPAGDTVATLIDERRDADGGRRAFGRLLDRADGVSIAGLRLERLGRGRPTYRIRSLRFTPPETASEGCADRPTSTD